MTPHATRLHLSIIALAVALMASLFHIGCCAGFLGIALAGLGLVVVLIMLNV